MTKPTKEYMKAWRIKNRERIRQGRAGKTRNDAKEVKGLPRVDKIAGLTLKDFIG